MRNGVSLTHFYPKAFFRAVSAVSHGFLFGTRKPKRVVRVGIILILSIMYNSANDLISLILVGGLLGVLGQGIRMTIGLKKHSDLNAQSLDGEANPIDGTRLMIGIFLGFIAGALYLMVNGGDLKNREFIFTVIAAGYAGTDFIEGLFNTYIAKLSPSKTVTGETISTAPTPTPIVINNIPPATTPVPQDPLMLPAGTNSAPISQTEREDDSSNNL